ncbi:hypothetical protein WME75_03270 [Sorangium sp. So ce1014]|uniref:hypothetical protein n=1 Tax=Sorangium sp. So ce1014 TaxID=3133326 RepID=UPI003F63F76D
MVSRSLGAWVVRLRDEHAPDGIAAVLVYPMNALAEDQLGRLRSLLTGTGIPFGMYVGKTPEKAADVVGERLGAGASRGDYEAAVRRLRAEKRPVAAIPPEERPSRDEMVAPGKRPRILLTNVKQLELLLTRQRDIELFAGATLDFLVFDEAHTSSGAAGAETACLTRRLRSLCGKRPDETVCIATSATIADPARGPEAGRRWRGRPRESTCEAAPRGRRSREALALRGVHAGAGAAGGDVRGDAEPVGRGAGRLGGCIASARRDGRRARSGGSRGRS